MEWNEFRKRQRISEHLYKPSMLLFHIEYREITYLCKHHIQQPMRKMLPEIEPTSRAAPDGGN